MLKWSSNKIYRKEAKTRAQCQLDQRSSYSEGLCSACQGTVHVTCTWYLTGNCWLIFKERSFSWNCWRSSRVCSQKRHFLRAPWCTEAAQCARTQESGGSSRAAATIPACPGSRSARPALLLVPPCHAADRTRLWARFSACSDRRLHFPLAVRSCDMWSFLQSCPKTSKQWHVAYRMQRHKAKTRHYSAAG